MTIDPSSGLFNNVQFLLSPNHDVRPLAADISLLVIHGISLPPGRFGSSDVLDFFMNELKIERDPYFAHLKNVGVSAHFFIRRTGALWQFVPTHLRAWHAGQSAFDGRQACNDFSIGIELEGADDMPYEEDQYKTLIPLVKSLMQAYPLITPDRIVGHSDIAPGRKTDPGLHFNWQAFREQLLATI